MKQYYNFFLLTIVVLYTASCSSMKKADLIKKTIPKNHIHNSMYMENSENNDFEDAIAKYKDKNNGKMSRISKDKDIVVVFGNTGSGKSTLLNLLLGHELKKHGIGYAVKKESLNRSMFEFNIGHTNTSETLFSQCIEAEDGTLYVDLPGLNDNRGSGTAFVNALCIKDILTQARSVKFLFVETQGAFETQRGEKFKELLKIVFNLLPDQEMLKYSSLFIITKTDKKQHKIIIKENILPKAPKELYQIFPENLLREKTVSFVKSDCSIFGKENFITYQKKLSKKIKDKIKNLTPINIKKIRTEILLNKNVKNKLYKICEKEANYFYSEYSKTININNYNRYNIQNLSKRRNDLSSEIEKELNNFLIKNTSIFSFIKIFDQELFNDTLNHANLKLEKNIKLLKEKMKNRIDIIEDEIKKDKEKEKQEKRRQEIAEENRRKKIEEEQKEKSRREQEEKNRILKEEKEEQRRLKEIRELEESRELMRQRQNAMLEERRNRNNVEFSISIECKIF